MYMYMHTGSKGKHPCLNFNCTFLSFVVKFQVRGKYVTILQIKKVSTTKVRQSKRRQIKRRYRFLIRNKVKTNGQPRPTYINQETSTPNVLLQTKETQTQKEKTTKTRLTNSWTQTKIILRKTTAQQTIACVRLPPCRLSGYKAKPFTLIAPILPETVYFTTSFTQTEFQTSTTGVQCKLRTYSAGTQTDRISVNSFCSQVGGCGVDFSQPDNTSGCEIIDLSVFCYMVAHLGEMVINQNHILKNNAKKLNQLKTSSELRKLVILEKYRRKKSFKIPFKTFKKAQKNYKSSISTQTDQQLDETRKFNQFSQTADDVKKPHTLSFLKKQLSKGNLRRKLSFSDGRST